MTYMSVYKFCSDANKKIYFCTLFCVVLHPGASLIFFVGVPRSNFCPCLREQSVPS
jgi:hypothetical protein